MRARVQRLRHGGSVTGSPVAGDIDEVTWAETLTAHQHTVTTPARRSPLLRNSSIT